jgi:hypothetical protein
MKIGLLLALAALGCSSKEQPPTTSQNTGSQNTGNNGNAGTDSGGTSNGGTSNGQPDDPNAPVVGTFAVTLVAATETREGFTSVLGAVRDAPMPEQLAWEVSATDQDCQLRVPSVPFCDPGCGSSAICAPGDECIAYPQSQDLGTITVSGLGDSEFSMELIAGAYQPPPAVRLPHPPSDEGATVRVTTSGGAYDPFSIDSTGIAPLELGGPELVPLDGREPLALQWQPPQDQDAARILIRLDISHHGGLKGEIVCDTADDGEHAVPAELIAQLIDLGTAGFPSFTVTRIASGSVNLEHGRVLLNVLSGTERFFSIPGIVSCNDNDECGDAGTCGVDRTCQ